MPGTGNRVNPTEGTGGKVRGDTLLGKVLKTLRARGGALPIYIEVLDRIAERGDVIPVLEAALAGIDDGRKDEIARKLIHSVAMAAFTSTMAPGLPERRSITEAGFYELFAALELLGAHFGVQEFPEVALPSDIPPLSDLDVDAELHRAVEARRVELGLAESTSDDPRFLRQLAFLRYKSEEASAALLAMWECLKIEENATLASLRIPGFSRKQIKDADRLSFILELDRDVRSALKRRHLKFLSLMTNILFDLNAGGGTTEGAIREYLRRSSVRDGQP